MFDHHHTGEKHGFFSMKIIPAFFCALVFLLGFAAAGAGLTGLTAHELLSGESTPEQWCQDMENIFR